MIYCRMINDEIHVESIIPGDDEGFMNSERHTEFSKEDTEKILSIMSFDKFEIFCKKEMSYGLIKFIKKHDLHPRCITI